MEIILYNVSKNIILVSLFMSIILFLGAIIYWNTRKFDIHKKSIRYFGLLTGLNNRQIIILSAIMIRTFVIIFSVCSYNKNILSQIIIILLADLVYIVLNPKKMFFESISIGAQGIIIYLINILQKYKIEIGNEMYVEQVAIILGIFLGMYSLYFLLKNFEELITESKKGTLNEKKK